MVEEIKLITQALQGMSTTAMWGLIAYLILGKLLNVALCYTGAIIIIKIVAQNLVKIFLPVIQEDNILKTIRDNLGIGSSGILTHSEIRSVREVLPKIIIAYQESLKK